MIKKIVMTVIGSFLVGLLILSFIDVYYEEGSTETSGFTYALGNINNNLKDVNNLSMREIDIITATSKGLVMKNNEGKVENELVEKINVKDNGLHYEFILKKDIKWSDGKDILPSDIVWFLKELIISEKEEDIQGVLNIYGAREFRASKGIDNSKLAIIEGENSITIRLNKKDSKFIEELTKPIYKLRKNVDLWADIKTTHNVIITSGNYVIDKVTDEEIILKKTAYVKENIPNEMNIIRNMSEETSMAKFETGEVDIVVNPPSKQLNRLEEEGRLKTFSAKTGKYLYINSIHKDMNLENRKVIYKTLLKAIEGYYEENSNYISMADYSYFVEDKSELNIVQGRKVSTTKSKGNLPKVLTMLALDTQENRVLCGYIEKWIKENTESTLSCILVKEEEYKNIALRDRYHTTLIGIEAIEIERGETFESLEHWYNEAENKLFNKEKVKVKSKFRELENSLFNNYRILPLYFENKNVAISENVDNISFDYYGNINFTTIQEK
ncbi:MAG: ABC transporter substrate-binding protein [Clostridium sp.]|uniref:ABC transporter substrate-binding protein n=1 Tax=Clostridium sp. TaxID=1506 RepID=UPI003EE5928F